ncbi:CnHHK5 [Papiliotrema laurentii]|uniref:histidine kinase n=1 Tax=Papiliotrema laurentii TaxID=5418 RepID=A0AAD9FPN8_PAPLA|nr:CnHHK5 [Papiliotrema laurentii]KAK1920716.1 CnHHK5 [Papiliotrema laurentii]
MSKPKDDGTVPISAPASKPVTVPAVVHSSAAFLHHLHTDPSSHHISLYASLNRNSASAPNKSPRSIHTPLEPTVVERNKPSGTPRTISTPSSLHGDSTAGPSSLRSLSRISSSRGRPSTAPSDHGPSPTPPGSFSPDLTSSAEDEHVDSSHEDLPQLLSGPDSCIGAFMATQAEVEGHMDLASDRPSPGSHRSVLLGSSGQLGLGPAHQESPQGAPVEQLGWKTFAKSYAHGLFDPNRTPNPPKPSSSSAGHSRNHTSPGKRYRPSAIVQPRADTVTSASSAGTMSSDSSIATISTHASSAPSIQEKTSPPHSASALPSKFKALELDDLPAKSSSTFPKPNKLVLPSYSLAAATVRVASSALRGSDFAPLGMPSPERELVDPMASVVSNDTATKESPSSDPAIGRYPLSRSMSSAVVAGSHQTFLPTIQASPVSTPNDTSHKGKGRAMERPANRGGVIPSRIPAATAPIEKVSEAESSLDYFGTVTAPHYDRQHSTTSHSSSSQTATERGTPAVHRAPSPDIPSSKNSPEFELPDLAYPQEIGPIYESVGWLPAPVPPQELERRKALYRFGILHTAKDINFDRIAHMAKLVFSTKIVLIALTDVDTQWHKSQSGLGVDEAKRISSFCSHTLLSRTDEPFVVLDTHLDWRFAKNPQVVGAPYIRFYAGAPLRTAEGYNLGSLCIIDDKPRTEFPPRSRLILKEFAAVTMREMELWRDKLQLRIRDRIQTSMERFTRECLEMDANSASNAEAAAKMDQVYSRAAQLVCSTLDLDGCFVLDISQFEMIEVETAEGKETMFRANPYFTETQSPVLKRSDSYGPVNPFPLLATTPNKVPTRPLTSMEHEKMSTFLRDHRDGQIFETVAPSWIRYMFPSALRYGMVVPVYGVDQQPFAMICAYTCNKAKQYLEGYELQFLRAIGVIILSAVLRRRMVLADKTKSILISSVSHELRTPLHGILAAAELLSDTDLDANQQSFLKTVQTCGNALIETVDHVLDFTKLSGSAQSAGQVKLARVNLASLVESTVEGCWIGQRARSFHGDSDIGSFYAPTASAGLIPRQQRDSIGAKLAHVETVIDIAQREMGWMVRCERGGLRRVLMNLVGNSLKFTKDGYVQITLRELPHPPRSRRIPVEMAVIDTGKGIGKDFLKEHLFHPFSQENPLQTGTGLGLSIVNSIVRSDSVNGKVDVWSSEGMGTEIRVSFEVEVVEDDDDESSTSSVISVNPTLGRGHSISFLGFSHEHRGHMLSLEVLSKYAAAWQFELDDQAKGDILVINEDEQLLRSLLDSGRPVISITTGRHGDAASSREPKIRNGGSCQIMYKPIGPSALRSTLSQAVRVLEDQPHDPTTPTAVEDADRPAMSRGSSGRSQESNSTVSELSYKKFEKSDPRAPLYRRRSEENEAQKRPSMAPRGITYHVTPGTRRPPGEDNAASANGSPQPGSSTSTISTISLADGGVMDKSAAVPVEGARRERVSRVLVVDDNVINRRVLGAFLKKMYTQAVDGQAAVEVFANSPPNYWDVILMDISMPVMNGHEATRAIRNIEATRKNPVDVPVVPPPGSPIKLPSPRAVQAWVKIFALTGLAATDDKREAFASGVDRYLVKPVSLKSLRLVFQSECDFGKACVT